MSRATSSRHLLPVALALVAVAQPAAAAPPATARPDPGDAADVAALADRVFGEEMGRRHVPGAVLVLVEDGRVVTARGFGLADLATRRPVDPAETVFRAGSVSKVVTAVAAVQLSERGRLRLDDDVNRHLRSWQLPPTDPAPVTLRHLLTHTGGFDERHLGMHVRRRADFLPLDAFLSRRMPPRVQPPGEVIAYSDFGLSLAGLIVQEAAGVPFERYVAENVFAPLGMTSSSFAQPMPEELQRRLATGYGWRGGVNVAYPYDFVEVSPAAALQTTGADMAAFMLACLQRGRLGDRRVLEEPSAEELLSRQATHHPRLRGRALGFSESLENGQRALFHDGGMPGFVARIYLVPEQRLGFFVAANGDVFAGATGLPRAFTTAFLKRYFPQAPPARLAPPPGAAARAPRYAGWYRPLHEYSRHTLEKVVSLEGQLPVTAGADGTLRIGRDAAVEVERGLYRRAETPDLVAFRDGPAGEVRYLFVGTAAFERLRWYEARPFHVALAGFFLLAALASPALAWRSGGAVRWLVVAQSGLQLATLVGVPVAMATLDRWEFMYGLPPAMKVLLCLPPLLAAVTVAQLLAAARPGRGGAAARAAGAGAVGLAFLGWLHYWNLLGFRV